MDRLVIDTEILKDVAGQFSGADTALADVYGKALQALASVRSAAPGQDNIIRSVSSLSSRINSAADRAGVLSGSCRTAAEMWEECEKRTVKYSMTQKGIDINVSMSFDALDGESVIFDDQGGYGGDQGDAKHNKSGFKFLFWRFGGDDELFNFVRQYEGYENASKDKITKLYDRMNNEGCGFVTVANTILAEFEGHEAEFEEKFGFPYYDDKGEPNFNKLLLDFYISTDDKFFLNDDSGMNALAISLLTPYLDNPESFKKKYGVDLLSDSSHYNIAALNKVIEEYEGQDVVELETGGMNQLTFDNRVDHYLNEKGIDFSKTDANETSNWTVQDVSEALDRGEVVSIACHDFNMYDANGKMVRKDVGGHLMTITGVTENGDYIVSSWGDKYYLKPSELDGPWYYDINIK